MDDRARGAKLSRWLAAALFVTTGTLHFARPALFAAIVPPALPAPAALVAVSGAAEIAGAVGLLLAPTRRTAVYGLIALLVAVFPANVYMAAEHARFAAVAPAAVLFARLPLQLLLVAWIWSLRPRTRM